VAASLSRYPYSTAPHALAYVLPLQIGSMNFKTCTGHYLVQSITPEISQYPVWYCNEVRLQDAGQNAPSEPFFPFAHALLNEVKLRAWSSEVFRVMHVAQVRDC